MSDPDLSPEAVEALAHKLERPTRMDWTQTVEAPRTLRALSAALTAAKARADAAEARAARMEGGAEDIGSRILKERRKRGVSLRELSRQTNVSFSVIAKIERGETAKVTPRVYAALNDWLSDAPPDTVAPPAPRNDRPTNPEDGGCGA